DGAAPRRGPLVRGEDAHAALWDAIKAPSVVDRGQVADPLLAREIEAVPQHHAQAVIGRRERLGRAHEGVQGFAVSLELARVIDADPFAVRLGRPSAGWKARRDFVGQAAGATIEPEKVRRAALVAEPVAEGGLGVEAKPERGVEEELRRDLASVNPDGAAGEVTGDV